MDTNSSNRSPNPTPNSKIAIFPECSFRVPRTNGRISIKALGIVGRVLAFWDNIVCTRMRTGEPEWEQIMNVHRLDFRLSVALVAVVATPAWAQTAAPAVGAASSNAQSAATIPDFSGIWAHLFCSDFEPPLTGPGPVTNRSRRNGAANNYQLVGDYTNPILRPQAAEVVKKHGEISLTGVPYPTPSNHCWPGGVPFVFWNIGMQLLQQPDKITILYSNDHEVRHVRLNQPHPADVTPSWYGDSVGHYEGDTLVIDTVGVKT